MKQFIVIINGPSGVGKSTASHILSRGLRKCAHVDVGLLQHFIPASTTHPAHVKLALLNASAVTNNFLAAGYRVIVDGVFATGAHVRQFLSQIADKEVPVYMYTLSGAFAVIKKRAEARPDDGDIKNLRQVCSKMSANQSALGEFVDTTQIGVTRTAETLLALFKKGEGLIAGGRARPAAKRGGAAHSKTRLLPR